MTNNIEQLKLLVQLYKSMDWSYAMSDDGSVYRRGKKAEKKLTSLLSTLNMDGPVIYGLSWQPSGTAELHGVVTNCAEYRQGWIELWETAIRLEEDGAYTIVCSDQTINLVGMPDEWVTGVRTIQKMKEEAGIEQLWPSKVYRWLRVQHVGPNRRKLSFDRRGWGELTYRVQKEFMVTMSLYMEALDLQTSLRHCTLTITKEE